MTRRILSLLAFIVLAIGSYAQGVDIERIEIEINNPGSQYYYPILFERYTMGDTTLTDKEYYYLYYGYATTDGYKPLLKNPYSDSLLNVLNTRSSHTADSFLRAIEYAKKILSIEPFNIREINVLAYAYNMLGNTQAAMKESYRLKMITKVITSTGDGSSKHPWWITYNPHADDILAIRKFTATKTVLISKEVMYIQAIEENRKRSNMFYFNYSLQYYNDPTYLLDQNGNFIKPEKKRLFK